MNHKPTGTSNSIQGQPPGFALIVTLSLMILLTVVAVGLLSLSAISLRGSSLGAASAEARANARVALMLALGELQKNAGLDTRVTAPADILDSENPPLTGVWRSWEGANHEGGGSFAGRPIAPDYPSKKTSAGSGGRFLSWLVSNDGSAASADKAKDLVRSVPFSKSVPLVSRGSLAENDKREVHVAPVPVSGRGTMAWWVSGENQKAYLPRPYQPAAESAAGWSVHAKSHSVADPLPFDLESLLDDALPAEKAYTRKSIDLIPGGGTSTGPRGFFHDLTASSVGLLTNTATGGWRKDFSHITENWNNQPKSGLPFFRLTPTLDTQASIPTSGSAYPKSSIIYPWAEYRGGANDIPIYRHGPVSTWENLYDFATHYKRVSGGANGVVRGTTHSVAIDNTGGGFGFIHKVRVLPVIARMQWVFSHNAGPAPAPAVPSQGLLQPRLLLTPVITMWNPYNVEITSPNTLRFQIPRPLPAAMKYTLGTVTNPNFNAVMGGGLNNLPALGAGTLIFNINSPFTLIPGETRLFSPQATTPVASNVALPLAPGYRSGGGHFFPVLGSAGQAVALPGSTVIRADAKFDTEYNDHGNHGVASGVGIYLDMFLPDNRRHLVYRMVYSPGIANVVYPELKNMASATLSQSVTNPQPFLSTIFGARTASNTHLAAKGFVQSSPFVNYTAMGKKDEEERTISRHYGGTGHPVNSPFDYSFVKHAPAGDSLLPNSSDATNRGYIVTGFNKSDGLSRCVIAELPLRPLASLGELVNWDMRYENPIPPFAINLIGNSDASPLLPSDKVVNSNDANLAVNLQYDDSYCANHLLFDDWFVSSITPDPVNFGSGGRTMEKTFTDFLDGKTPLSNRAYRPILADRAAAADGKATKVYTDHVRPVDAWKSIASRLEVEGMFNVNSTSVAAWRALLGHARDQRVPFINETGRNWSAVLSEPTDHVLTRFSVSADTEAGKLGTSGAFPEATEFAGYRTVDDKFIDAMAEEVVRQVRARGPFLSLAEFVNRQLSSGDLALAGTIQSALNEVSKKSGTNPFSALQALSSASSATPQQAANGSAEYKFAAAAVGHSGYGMPGWTRQADILRPLAPILSARDDTFTIRAHGDARSPDGKVLATAVCEAVVRRTRDYVDPADAAERFTQPVRATNLMFGRRFEITSFRWLAPSEV